MLELNHTTTSNLEGSNHSTPEFPTHIAVVFCLALTTVMFIFRKLLNEVTLSTKAIKAQSSVLIKPTKKASVTDVCYKSLRKTRYIRVFKSKGSVRNLTDGRLKLKGPKQFKDQLKALLTNRHKRNCLTNVAGHQAPKLEEFLVLPSDVEAVLTEEKVNLIKTVQNFLEKVLGEPISSLLTSPSGTDLVKYSQLFEIIKKSSLQTRNSEDKVDKGTFTAMNETNELNVLEREQTSGETLTPQNSGDISPQTAVINSNEDQTSTSEHITASAESGNATTVGPPRIGNPKSFTTLFSNTAVTTESSSCSLDPIILGKEPSVEDFSETSSEDRTPKGDLSGIFNPPKDGCASLDDLLKMTDAGDGTIDGVIGLGPMESFVSIGFNAEDLSQVPSWNCW